MKTATQSQTVWISVGLILVAAGAALSGQSDWTVAGGLIMTQLYNLFQRVMSLRAEAARERARIEAGGGA
jgi:hypothetical protein